MIGEIRILLIRFFQGFGALYICIILFFLGIPSERKKQRGILDIHNIQENPEPTIIKNLWIQGCFHIYYNIIILNVLTWILGIFCLD